MEHKEQGPNPDDPAATTRPASMGKGLCFRLLLLGYSQKSQIRRFVPLGLITAKWKANQPTTGQQDEDRPRTLGLACTSKSAAIAKATDQQ